MKTKILSAIAAILMIASLAGCSSSAPERGNISNETGANTEASTDSKVEYKAPVREGNTYSSTTLGTKITLDEGWTFSTDEEMKELNQSLANAVGDDYAEQLKNVDVIYDMNAMNDSTGDNISVNFENLGKLYGKILTAESYINLSKDNVKGVLESMGCENIELDVRDVKFAGQDEKALYVKASLAGVPVYEICVAKSCGDYMANIAITTVLEDGTADILAKFVPID